MRHIPVSTPVYAAIWANRKEGEETEDEILARYFKVSIEPSARQSHSNNRSSGLHDARNDVWFEEGFEIERTYKGTSFRAQVKNGKWLLLNNMKEFPTLNQMNSSIVSGAENAWNAWKFRENGRLKSINKLRK